MGPVSRVSRTYSRNTRVAPIAEKDDPFDMLLGKGGNSRVFESSSDMEKSRQTPVLSSRPDENSKTSSSQAEIKENPSSHVSRVDVSWTFYPLDFSDLSYEEHGFSQPRPRLVQKKKKKLAGVAKARPRKAFRPALSKLVKESHLVTSTPVNLRVQVLINSLGRCVSPIRRPNRNPISSLDVTSQSPAREACEIVPKNILDSAEDKSVLEEQESNFIGFDSVSTSRQLFDIVKNQPCQVEENFEIDSTSFIDCTANTFSKKSSRDKHLSFSLQNLNLSDKSEKKAVSKSLSLDESAPDSLSAQSTPLSGGKLNAVETSDFEESAVTSADERSGARSASDDEYERTEGSGRQRASVASSKLDSESAIFSATCKDIPQSGEGSADDLDPYCDSPEVAKSSGESVHPTPFAPSNGTNITSETQESSLFSHSTGEGLDGSDSSVVRSSPSPLVSCESGPSCSVGLGGGARRGRTKAKDRRDAAYSTLGADSDSSELSFDSGDSGTEQSCESSSRKSSLESCITPEKLQQLKECVSRLKIQDGVEEALSRRKTKSGRGWRECPASPRRSAFPPLLSPLGPLQEEEGEPAEQSPPPPLHTPHERRSRSRLLLKEEVSSGEDSSSRSSPVREARLRRSSRLSKKKESESRLNMVVEECDSEAAAGAAEPERLALPPGKKFRRSLLILRRLTTASEEQPSPSTLTHSRGRNYPLLLKTIIDLQFKSERESVRGEVEVRKSLCFRRQSLLSQLCRESSFSAATSSPASFRQSVRHSSTAVRRFSRLSRLPQEEDVVRLAEVPELEASWRSEASLSPSPQQASSCSLQSPAVRRFSRLSRLPQEGDVVRLAEVPELEASRRSEASLSPSPQQASSCSLQSPEESLEEGEGSPLRQTVPPKDIIFKCCQQTDFVAIDDILPLDEWPKEAKKLGEGAFGEVFLIPRENSKNVIKIVPLEGDALVNGEKQKTYAEVANELLISVALHGLSQRNFEGFETNGFAEVLMSRVVRGEYPEQLLRLWREYDQKTGSENDCPSMFGPSQLYLVLELGNAGEDLEKYSFSSARQGLAVFKQTVLALAVAEACLEFEHRDLHWGNVLVSKTSDKNIEFVLNGTRHTLASHGVKATIIDFTLSRMTCYGFPWYYDIGQDPDMFISTGDYQYDVYRDMKEDVCDRWWEFVPKTNVRWLHYLIDKMIHRVRYQRRTARVHHNSLKSLKEYEAWILGCGSAVEVAQRIL